MPIVFITGNPKKLAQVQQYVKTPLEYQDIDLPEIQSLDVTEIVTYKASEAYKIVGKPVLVEDVSLQFHALGKLPGPFIKWFLHEISLENMCNLVTEDRSATVELCYGFYDGKECCLFSDIVEGTIAKKPEGSNGFGYDSIFIPKGYTITRGQMNQEDYEKTSPRKGALMKFEAYLETEYNIK